MALLEAAELARIRQRQIKEYDPNLGAMARAQEQIEDIIFNGKLSDEEKMALINLAHQRIETLTRTTGPISKVATVRSVPLTPDAQPTEALPKTPQPKTPERESTLPLPSNTSTPDTTVASSSKGKDDGADSTQLKDYHTLKYMINQKDPKVIRTNKSGELILNNRRVTGSKTEDILKALVTGKDLDSTRGVSEMVNCIQSMTPSKRMFHSPTLLSRLFPLSPSPKHDIKIPPTSMSLHHQISPTSSPTHSLSVTQAPKRSRQSQKGKGLVHPPGKRPRILWLYR